MAEKVQRVRARRMKMAMTMPKEMATLLLILEIVEIIGGGLMFCGIVVFVKDGFSKSSERGRKVQKISCLCL
jgi:hypothetical protein